MSPTPPATPTRPPERAAISVIVVLVVGLLFYRGYGSKFQTKPTQQTVASSPLNVNTADRAELLQVPGVGPSLADAILSHRNTFGPFNSVDELDGVKGIGGKTLDKLRPWLHAEAGPVARGQQPEVERLERKPDPPRTFTPTKKLEADKTINVNQASLEELQQLPGIGPKLAERIFQEREKQPFLTAEDLRRVGGIGAKTVEKLRPHLRFTDPR